MYMRTSSFQNLNVAGSINHDGSSIGFFGSTPATQATNIPDFAASANVGGSVNCTQATVDDLTTISATLNAVLDVLERHGLMAVG